MENNWFISDTHFGHDRLDPQTGEHRGIITFERHKFHTIQEHDMYIVNKLKDWAAKHEGATLWHLGDFGDWSYMWLINYLRHEHCIKVNFVQGNHDSNVFANNYAEDFDNFYKYPVYICNRVIVSHEPVYPCPQGVLNIHGHLHGAKLDSDQHINVSMALLNDYVPLGWKSVAKALAKIDKPNFKFLEEAYADRYVFTEPREDVVCKDKQKGLIDLPATLAKKKALDDRLKI